MLIKVVNSNGVGGRGSLKNCYGVKGEGVGCVSEQQGGGLVRRGGNEAAERLGVGLTSLSPK